MIALRKIILGAILFSSSSVFFYNFSGQEYLMARTINNVQDVINLFPTSIQQVHACSKNAQNDFKSSVQALLDLQKEEYDFERVAEFYDREESALFQAFSIMYVLKETHPNEAIRKAADESFLELEKCLLEVSYHNEKLYKVFKTLDEELAKHTDLSPEQRLYLDKMLSDFHRRGIDLPEKQRKDVERLNLEISELCNEFERNISLDNRSISVERENLEGLSEDFIDALDKDDQGRFVLGTDYPTVFQVFESCSNADTRKKMWIAFNNRANPANKFVLDSILEKREELARHLGYENYSTFELEDEMAQNPERVQQFLDDLISRSQKKALKEFEIITKDASSEVKLSAEGNVFPWDVTFLQELYKKKHFAIDEAKLAEYFPLQHSLEQLLDIYTQFLGVLFEEVEIGAQDFWHEDIKLLRVSLNESDQVIGYILLDLHPRPNKFSHAAQIDVVQAMKKEDGSRSTAVALVMANFPKATAKTPALLKRDDVITFFHEFGHAIHSLLGATEMAFFAGTRVKTDFVEMPSQMLEEWMWDFNILKKVSSHYLTGESLSDEQIDNILKIKHFESGYWVLRQCVFSQLALDLHKVCSKDPGALYEEISNKLIPFIEFEPEGKFYLSFGHLTGYGARYYSYLWSKVFALDLFSHIKERGLLDSSIGKRYMSEILNKGGSLDPNVLLKNFLGRNPSNQAFFDDLGL